jgi:HIP---CoA ligase
MPVELIRRMREELGFETVITGVRADGVLRDRLDVPPTTTPRRSRRLRAARSPASRCAASTPTASEVPRGTPGEVVVRGYNVMRGYFEDEAETAKAIDADGWLHTGDVGVMDERGYLRITDRIKDMFIMGGFNCYPAEIENLLYRHPGWSRQVAVVGVPDERLGEVGMAFVVPAPGRALRSPRR